MKEFFKNLKFVWKYSKGQKWSLLAFAFCSFISIFVGIVIPIVSSKVIVSLSNSLLEELIGMSIIIFNRKCKICTLVYHYLFFSKVF